MDYFGVLHYEDERLEKYTCGCDVTPTRALVGVTSHPHVYYYTQHLENMANIIQMQSLFNDIRAVCI